MTNHQLVKEQGLEFSVEVFCLFYCPIHTSLPIYPVCTPFHLAVDQDDLK